MWGCQSTDMIAWVACSLTRGCRMTIHQGQHVGVCVANLEFTDDSSVRILFYLTYQRFHIRELRYPPKKIHEV